MKKFFSILLSVIFVFCGLSVNLDIFPIEATAAVAETSSKREFRGVWISFFELKPIIYNKSETEFTLSVNQMFEKIKTAKLSDVIVQVRPFSDAIYPSKIFPQSHILSGTQGRGCGYDPLKIMIEVAHNKGLKLHAWVNPYRIKNPGSAFEIVTSHPAYNWIKDNTSDIIKLDNGTIYYNPGSKNAIDLIIKGIEELVAEYDIDGIHLDDYFYPSQNTNIDETSYKAYLQTNPTSPLSLQSWRMNNINYLINQIYLKIKSIKSDVLFGISPSGSIKNNYSLHYADVKKWISEPNFVDYLCPQIYYGFENEASPFLTTLNEWGSLKKIESVKLYVGIGAYKINTIDKWAKGGQNEWINNHNIIGRQIEAMRKNKNFDGFMLFSYGSLFGDNIENEQAVNNELYNMIMRLT